MQCITTFYCNNLHLTKQRIITFSCNLGVRAVVIVLYWYSPSQAVLCKEHIDLLV